jgi:hypothetical protein
VRVGLKSWPDQESPNPREAVFQSVVARSRGRRGWSKSRGALLTSSMESGRTIKPVHIHVVC